jgi:hypothetical protein
MPEHGDYDSESKRWFCTYWMTEHDWMDTHHYSPSIVLGEEEEDNSEELL